MEGKETDALFAMNNCKVKIAYLNGSDNIMSPPIELLEFVNNKTIKDKPQLNKISTSLFLNIFRYNNVIIIRFFNNRAKNYVL